MAKKARNDTEIEARYKSGEAPRVIAADYKNVTGSIISQMAKRKGWKKEKDTLRQEVVETVMESVRNDLKALCEINERVHKQFMEKLESNLADITNPFLFDGERHNPLFQTAMNNATKIMLAQMKFNQEEEARVREAEASKKNQRSRVVVEFKRPEKRQ